ncbi:hypothetical protein IX329_000010 [Fusobacterium necrophorum]|nr:DNA-processing protein DprA [Fusobacterium necrophorum]MBR8732440.1 hypothetical protein [Fusobacterium necrophorum]MBR8788616.1 hypothetical protein [Fusobacterium necrophorum]
MYSKRELLLFSILQTYSEGRYANMLQRLFSSSKGRRDSYFLDSFLGKDAFMQEEKKKLAFLWEENRKQELEEEIRKVEETCHKNGIQLLFYGEEKYPSLLKEIKNPPYVLYIRGKFPSEETLHGAYALIGTRDCSAKGKEFAKRAGQYFKKKQIYNISGLARGIDSIGHMETLGQTGAILGQGLATEIYPKENGYLASRILDTGGFLLSELPPFAPVSVQHLIQRNRLQTALTSGIVLAEVALQGGSMHTFQFAKEQGKKIYVASFNQDFIRKYYKEVIVLENIYQFEKKQKEGLEQKSLF